jgi:hypothetical protein
VPLRSLCGIVLLIFTGGNGFYLTGGLVFGEVEFLFNFTLAAVNS